MGRVLIRDQLLKKGDLREGGRNDPTLYAHMNKRNLKKKRRKEISSLGGEAQIQCRPVMLTQTNRELWNENSMPKWSVVGLQRKDLCHLP
jgi:hypothetical protein